MSNKRPSAAADNAAAGPPRTRQRTDDGDTAAAATPAEAGRARLVACRSLQRRVTVDIRDGWIGAGVEEQGEDPSRARRSRTVRGCRPIAADVPCIDVGAVCDDRRRGFGSIRPRAQREGKISGIVRRNVRINHRPVDA